MAPWRGQCHTAQHSRTSYLCPGPQVELSRAVRFALWDYKPEAALTAVCDADVQKHCPKGGKARNKGVFTIGVVGGWRWLLMLMLMIS